MFNNLNFVSNDRSLLSNYRELDIFFEEKKIGIEFNGIFWHSELNKPNDYHYSKYKECLDKGIRLINVWEDDWIYKNSIVKSIIKTNLGIIDNKIYARNLMIKLIDNKKSKSFLEKNHLQGFTPSDINIGLVDDNGDLYSIMTFGKRKISGKIYFELIRFCSILDTIVIGSASKIFNFFCQNYLKSGDKVISYCDVSMFGGSLYQKLGFSLDRFNRINYYWVVDYIKKNRFNFNKQRLVKMGYDKNMSEKEIMNSLGYYRIFGCGTQKWVWNR